jgi:hypothetical protein
MDGRSKLQHWEITALVAGVLVIACQVPFCAGLLTDWRAWIFLGPMNALAIVTFVRCALKLTR